MMTYKTVWRWQIFKLVESVKESAERDREKERDRETERLLET